MASATPKVQAIATTGPVADLVRNVGGDHVNVTALMGPGIDPHLYQAHTDDLTLLASADLIFYNGLHLEAQMGEVFAQMARRGITTIAIAEQLDTARLISTPTFAAGHDPHIWHAVSLWAQTIPIVRDTLSAHDPDHAADYRRNAERYAAELDALHQYVLSEANRIPLQRRVLITAHDAFGYFGRAYGFEVHGLQGLSTEVNLQDMQELTDFIIRWQVPAIFVESSVPQGLIETMQAMLKGKGFDVAIGGRLFSDALGEPGTPEGTYTGMVKYNMNTIVQALLGRP